MHSVPVNVTPLNAFHGVRPVRRFERPHVFIGEVNFESVHGYLEMIDLRCSDDWGYDSGFGTRL